MGIFRVLNNIFWAAPDTNSGGLPKDLEEHLKSLEIGYNPDRLTALEKREKTFVKEIAPKNTRMKDENDKKKRIKDENDKKKIKNPAGSPEKEI